MSKPLVSVVIPAYNAAKTIQSTVQSVLGQTIQNFEIIVIDDGSKDNTIEVAESIKDSRVKVLPQQNGGASAARNIGIKASQGKYIAFLDADDLWLPHKLERQLDVLTNEKDVTAVQSGVYFVNDSLKVLSARLCFQPEDVLLETLLFQNLPGLMSTLVVERSVFDEIGYLDTSLEILEDWELAIRLSRFCNLESIEEPLTLYRQHPENRSKNLDIHIKPGYTIIERLFKDSTIPDHIRKQHRLIYSTFYRMLCGGAFNVSRYGESLKWGLKSLLTHPSSIIYIASLPFRNRQRNTSYENMTEEYKVNLAKFLKQYTGAG